MLFSLSQTSTDYFLYIFFMGVLRLNETLIIASTGGEVFSRFAISITIAPVFLIFFIGRSFKRIRKQFAFLMNNDRFGNFVKALLVYNRSIILLIQDSIDHSQPKILSRRNIFLFFVNQSRETEGLFWDVIYGS